MFVVYKICMKTTSFLIVSFLLILAVSSCNVSNRYVTTEKVVLDSVYGKNKKKLNDICQEILSFDGIKKTLNKKIVIADSLKSNDDFMLEALPQLMPDSTYLNKEYEFDPSNIILVSKYDALSLFGYNIDTLTTNKNYKFDLSFINDNDQYPSADYISVWDVHQNKELDTNSLDSLSNTQKKDKISLFTEEFDKIKNSKYIVYTYDTSYLKPKIYLKEKKFETALLLTKVIVFDRLKKSKIGETTLLISNTDKVATTISVMIDDKINSSVKIKEVENNLASVKLNKIVNYLKRVKDSTTH